MASSMVICTFLSAPMMFMSAQVISINKDYADQMKKFGFNLSIVSLVVLVWVLTVFIVTKKYKRMPHRLTLCLMVSQVNLLFVTCLIENRIPDRRNYERSAQFELRIVPSR